MGGYDQKIAEGAQPFLAPGEQVLAQVIARPRGWTQANAGSLQLGSQQMGQANAGAEAAGFQLASPMSLVVTSQRLLCLLIGSPLGMGKGGEVKELVSAVPLADVDNIKLKSLLLGKVITLTVAGEEFKLEVNAGADAKGLVKAFEGARPA
jgi:hypothetical protein